MSKAQTLDIDVGAALRAEHVCLESDEFVVAERPREFRVGPTFKFASGSRGCVTELAFCTDDRLAIRLRKPRQPLRTYAVDLRFVDSEPVVRRRVAWGYWHAAAAFATLGALWYWPGPQLADLQWQQAGLPASIGMLAAALCMALYAWYRTRETIELRSLHGRALLAEIVGNVGSLRASGTFMTELVRRVEAARSQARQTRQQVLRDEMREHHRLWSEGVLPDASYEACKRRILQAHG